MIKAALAVIAAFGISVVASEAASIVNRDATAHVVTVTEGGNRTELAIEANQTVDFCVSGCFLTLPNGDRQVLNGGETVEIEGGVARIR
jgi:hypothetical protein